ncbi:MAG TPA: hypothetical protein VMG08_13385 [Allosphingosinicella sp.]|nr:hypothetical protein [Allosphingosinicella sp.]
MTARHLVIVRNLSARTRSFYVFQQQAVFSGAGTAFEVSSSSLGAGLLAPHDSSGAQLDFAFDRTVHIGAKRLALLRSPAACGPALPPGETTGAVSQTWAARPIELATGGGAGNHAVLTLAPLGLSPPTDRPAVPAGSFGMEIPPCAPAIFARLHCGCAVVDGHGRISLSSSVMPLPNSQLLCTPVPVYYVKAGHHDIGQPVAYDISQSASCDFTRGQSTIYIGYNQDGTFGVTAEY